MFAWVFAWVCAGARECAQARECARACECARPEASSGLSVLGTILSHNIC